VTAEERLAALDAEVRLSGEAIIMHLAPKLPPDLYVMPSRKVRGWHCRICDLSREHIMQFRRGAEGVQFWTVSPPPIENLPRFVAIWCNGEPYVPGKEPSCLTESSSQ